MKKPPSKVRSTGFTILELMIAVAVLGIVVGIAVPAFTDIIRRNRLASQANELLGAAAIARSEAVKRGTLVTLCPVTAAAPDVCAANDQWSNGWIVFSDVKGTVGAVDTTGAQPIDEILHRSSAPSLQKVGITLAGLNYFSYRGDGGVTFPVVGMNKAEFAVVPEGCVDPRGARRVTVIAAGRASSTRVDCP